MVRFEISKMQEDLHRLRAFGRKNAQRELLATFPGTPSQHEYAIILQQAFRARAAKRELARKVAGAEAAALIAAKEERELRHIRERHRHEFKSSYAQQIQSDIEMARAAEAVQVR